MPSETNQHQHEGEGASASFTCLRADDTLCVRLHPPLLSQLLEDIFLGSRHGGTESTIRVAHLTRCTHQNRRPPRGDAQSVTTVGENKDTAAKNHKTMHKQWVRCTEQTGKEAAEAVVRGFARTHTRTGAAKQERSASGAPLGDPHLQHHTELWWPHAHLHSNRLPPPNTLHESGTLTCPPPPPPHHGDVSAVCPCEQTPRPTRQTLFHERKPGPDFATELHDVQAREPWIQAPLEWRQ